MKKFLAPLLIGIAAMTLMTGCLALQVGGGTTTRAQSQTLGQQLVDLQHAKDTGAITDAEYQTQKAKLLESK